MRRVCLCLKKSKRENPTHRVLIESHEFPERCGCIYNARKTSSLPLQKLHHLHCWNPNQWRANRRIRGGAPADDAPSRIFLSFYSKSGQLLFRFSNMSFKNFHHPSM